MAFAGSVALAATALVGCGSDDGDNDGDDGDNGSSESGSDFADRDAQEILDAAEDATKNASSVHLAGSAEEDGEEVEIDLTLGEAGCEGTITAQGAEVEVLGVDGEGWFRASDAFWEQQAGEAAAQILPLISGKWILDSEGQFEDFCSIETFFEGDDGESDERENLEKGDVEDIDGTEAIALTYVEDGEDVTAWVAVDEPNYLLRVTNDQAGELNLSEFDEDVTFEAPAASEVVDLNDLG